MRILLASHLPFGLCRPGVQVDALAGHLIARGHQVQALAVLNESEACPSTPPELKVHQVFCRAGGATADVPFDLPGFEEHKQRTTFNALSDSQIAHYRDALRNRLDYSIEAFNPDVIHCLQLWIFGHLALESGAPYLMTARGPELGMLRADARYHRLIEQALENAGAVLPVDSCVREQLLALFPEAAEVTSLEPNVDEFPSLYESVLARRSGKH